ncbi:MAG: helix-turn-helix transcriptional regulator [archaeon]|nr:helix-turn-helix transcriptional regulator [archaeon]
MSAFYAKFTQGNQKAILEKAIAKAGSERKLSELIGIPSSTIYYYKTEKVNLPLERLEKILGFLGISKTLLDYELIDPHTYHKKGGIIAFQNHQKNGSLEKVLKNAQLKASEKMRQWHSSMKINNPLEYYQIQYSRF